MIKNIAIKDNKISFIIYLKNILKKSIFESKRNKYILNIKTVMYTIETLIQQMGTFKMILIGIGVLFTIMFGIVMYNFYNMLQVKQNNEDEHKKQLLSIAMNKHNILTLKSYIDEENEKDNELVHESIDKLAALSTKINNNETKIASQSSLLESVSDSVDKNTRDIQNVDRDVIQNQESISNLNREIRQYKNDQANIISSINEKHNNIQTQIGTFKYNDFEVLRENLNSNNIFLTNLESNMTSMGQSIASVESDLNTKLTKDDVDSRLSDYFNSTILPKIDSVESNLSGVMTNEVAAINANLSTNYQTNEELTTQFNDIYSGIQGVSTEMTNQVNAINTNLSNNYQTNEQLNTRFMDVNYEMITKITDVQNTFDSTIRELDSKIDGIDQQFEVLSSNLKTETSQEIQDSLTSFENDYMLSTDINTKFEDVTRYYDEINSEVQRINSNMVAFERQFMTIDLEQEMISEEQ